MRITLISMPWAIFYRPSIQLGALAAYLDRQLPELSLDCLHPYLSVAKTIGFKQYKTISGNPWAGEALYSALLFPENKKQAKQLFQRELPELGNCFTLFTTLLEDHFTSWLEHYDFSDCDLLGFSICFSQLIPSLYGAGQIKKRHPGIPVVFGGSTCTPTVGTSLLGVFSQVDYVITGEGEKPLLGLLDHLRHQEDPVPANVLNRTPRAKIKSLPDNQEEKDLNTLPAPRYDHYFHELAELGLSFIPELPIEFSRGCWWNKCSFCNLNLQWCGYRFKNHAKMTAEIRTLVRRHQCLDFFFADNALPTKEALTFFQYVAEEEIDLRFFAEIRAPKTGKECRIYKQGGLQTIQVGIEALADPLLQRMHKGTTVMDNIYAMKMAISFGIRLEGNLILEFPGSTEQDVRQTLTVLAAILPYPPLQAATFFLGEGSPVSINPEKFGIRAITRHPNNRLLFPEKTLEKLHLPISGYQGDRMIQRRRWQPVRKSMAAWTAFHDNRTTPSRPALSLRDGGDFLLLRQERPDQPTLHHRLKGMSRDIYLACDRPVSKKLLLQRFKKIKEAQLTVFIDDLCAKHLMYSNGSHCLALAVREQQI